MSESNNKNDGGFKLVRKAEEPGEAVVVDNIELSYEALTDFVAPRAFGSMILGSVVGMSSAFVAGEAIAVPFYTMGIAGAVVGTTFHAGSYALRYYRKSDDMLNYASCGALHGLVIGSATKGYRRGGVLGLSCGVAGAAYFVFGSWFYDVTRRAWINHKKNMLLAVSRAPLGKAQPFEPRQNGLPSISNRYTPVPEDDHSLIATARRYLQSLDREEAEKRNQK